MKTKEKIISKVNSINDEQLLEEILDLLNIESDLEEIYRVSETQKVAIEEGFLDIKEGRVYSQEDADELTKKWLKRS